MSDADGLDATMRALVETAVPDASTPDAAGWAEVAAIATLLGA